jgi:subfamily B ATP-binding cassette protein MsbA
VEIFKRILVFIKPYWKHITTSIVFTFLYALMHGLSIYLTIPLLDTLFLQNEVSQSEASSDSSAGSLLPIEGWFDETVAEIKNAFETYILSGSTTEVLFNICILIMIAFVAKNLFSYLQAYFLAYVEQGLIRDLRDKTYYHLNKLSLSYFKNEKTGDLMSRFSNDVFLVQTSVSAIFLSLFREPITILVFFVIAVTISWQLTIFSFLILPVSILIIAYIGMKLRKQSYILQKRMGGIASLLHETIVGAKIVKAFGMEGYENDKFTSQTQKIFQLSLKKVRTRNFASPSTEIIAVIVGTFIIYYGGQLVLVDKSLKASEFITFIFAIFQMMPPMKQISSINNKLQESIAGAKRIFEILDSEPTIKDDINPLRLEGMKQGIKFENVSFHYEDSPELVLNNISLTANKGEIIALVGSSGAGKTTLVDLIPRFYDPTSGKILIDDIDIKKASVKDVRSLMGIVTQETVLFNESVKNNIAYGLQDFPEEKVIEASKIANAHNFILELPKQYETMIGERGVKLSGGQRQRLSIARALLKNPPIMIFDEATSALDNESEVLVQEAIERLMADRTTFVIAHRLSTIMNADRILVMDKGKIVQDGRHEQLIEDEKGIYKKLYELQFREV